jgi:di/tricarboxylate transporter
MKFNLSKKYIWLFVLLFILIAVVALHVLTHKTQGLEGFEDPTNNVISTTIPAMPVQATFAPTIQAAVAATMPAAASAPVSAVVPATAMTQPTQQQPVQQLQQQYNAPSTFSNANLVNDSNGQANLVINEKGLFGSMTNGKP